MELFYADNRLAPVHISLYVSLFQVWNQHRFQNPISILREEVMKAAKISSYTTYTKVMRELNDWNYIRYQTSYNPSIGTKVEIYSFCNGECKGECNASLTDSVMVSVNVPYINSTNSKHRERESPPTEEEILIFFKKEKFPETEARKFYHHYEAIAWQVGKSPIKNWRAAAQKWMLNAEDFNSHGKASKREIKSASKGEDQFGTDKNYSEPL